ncbi:hypothetical protein DLJ53_32160 [Acuticoccus sediminis]|uniref:Tat pathway signal sequence domain protein n=1 Tax=Acuticoccus sediminis TaxID=2184697 RepID=A0A8B2NDB4_9HYPH|nr:hypothetical protein [Acuticoccus sediminis]RAH96564.1 hypothetical protein DLJ53_32160 [Acuticoccus sediminis]
MSLPYSVRLAVVCLALGGLVPPAAAQDAQVAATRAAPAAAAGHAIDLSLNSLAPSGEGCRISFVVRNGMGAEIEDFGVEVAVFDGDGGLDQLLRFSFGMLLEGKTRVKQFDLAQKTCDQIGRVLVNDVVRCEGDGLTPLMCLRSLSARSDASTPFGL